MFISHTRNVFNHSMHHYLGYTRIFFPKLFLQSDQNWLRPTLSRSYSQYVEDTAEYRYVTDFELSIKFPLNFPGHDWPEILPQPKLWIYDEGRLSTQNPNKNQVLSNTSQTSNYVEDEHNPRQPSFAFRDFYSGRRWSMIDPFYYLLEILGCKHWNSDQTQARTTRCRCHGEPTSKRHNVEFLPGVPLPFK